MVEDDARARFTAELAVIHDLSAVGVDVFKDMAGVGDDEPAGGTLATLLAQGGATAVGHAVQQLAHGLAHQGHVFQVHAGFRLVEEQQVGLLGHELQQLGTLDLAAGEAGVDVAVQEGIEMHALGHGGDVHLAAAAAQFHHLARGQAVDGGRALEGHADAQAGALVHGRVGDVVALEDDLAPGHLVTGKAHQRHEQGGLAGAVGAEQDKGFARFHLQVDALEHRRAVDGNVQVLDLKHCFPQLCRKSSPVREPGRLSSPGGRFRPDIP